MNHKRTYNAQGQKITVGTVVMGSLLHRLQNNAYTVLEITNLPERHPLRRVQTSIHFGEDGYEEVWTENDGLFLRVDGGWIDPKDVRIILQPSQVALTGDEYANLAHQDHWLNLLEQAGIDNTDAYGFAVDRLEECPCPCTACQNEMLEESEG